MSDDQRPMDLGIREFTDISVERAELWHGDKPWDANKWAVAFVGEAGEACNILKKLNRIRDGIASEGDALVPQLRSELATELADAFSYLVLLADELDIDLAAETVKKFNRVSDREGWPFLKLTELFEPIIGADPEIVPLAEVVNLGPDYDDGQPDWTGEP